MLAYSLAGTSAAALFSLLLVPIGFRLAPRSTFRVVIGFCAGIGFLQFLWYPLKSFYNGRGDFRQWPELLSPHGGWIMPILYVCTLPLGYFVGRMFFRMVDGRLPGSSAEERRLCVIGSVGALFAAGMVAYAVRMGFSATTPGFLVFTGVGGLIAAARIGSGESTVPVNDKASVFLVPACLLVLIEVLLIACDGHIPMPV